MVVFPRGTGAKAMSSITINIPEPTTQMFGGFPEIRMVGVVSDQDIPNAGGRLVAWDKGIVRIASHVTDNFAGIIPAGYGSIPAGKPFWITKQGPSLALTAPPQDLPHGVRWANDSGGDSV
jgi:hypothetical protein